MAARAWILAGPYMPLGIDGREYLTAAEICKLVGVSRQTLWRWRQTTRIPAGQRFRGRNLVFGPDEVAMIQRYAMSLEPAGSPYQQGFGFPRRDAVAVQKK